jgi:putative membrane protein
MANPPETKPKAALSDYLAAERTLLAWIRTGLALMGFGFVVARFGLFLRQLQLVKLDNASTLGHAYGESLWIGTALIGAGILVNVLAGLHHLQLVRTLDRGTTETAHSTVLGVAVALFLALVGLAMAIYLISIRS